MRYYIADLHFGHERLNQYMDQRGFENAEAMNEYMISRWNSRVKRGDDVIILGDFCLAKKPDEVHELLDKLNGNKYLIVGNHDKYVESRLFDKSRFGWIKPYMEMSDNKRKVILSHYPIMCYNGQYRLDKDGMPTTFMLYGHVHNTYDEYLINEYLRSIADNTRMIKGTDEPVRIPCRMINCFCMFSDYLPLTLDEWIELDRKRREEYFKKH